MSKLLKKILFKLAHSTVHLHPEGLVRGNVLISYTTLPFTSPEKLDGHPVRFDCKCIAETFLSYGFAVDIIEYDNKSFVPKKHYAYCIDVQDNLARLSQYLNKDCIKIFHIPAAHWLFQNRGEYQRLLDIKDRRGFILSPKRHLEPSFNMEYADKATVLIGTDFVKSTYTYAKKPIHEIHVTSPHSWPRPPKKNFNEARKNYIWIGGAGMAHKGLDLVLEAFVDMPKFNLVIFGKKDEDFGKAYEKELFKTQNIKFYGHIDTGSDEFKKFAEKSIGVISVSASEGGNAAVLETMQRGVIPIVGYQASVQTGNFGILLSKNDIPSIKKAVQDLSSLSDEELSRRSIDSWEYVEKNHTREKVRQEYKDYIGTLVGNH